MKVIPVHAWEKGESGSFIVGEVDSVLNEIIGSDVWTPISMLLTSKLNMNHIKFRVIENL